MTFFKPFITMRIAFILCLSLALFVLVHAMSLRADALGSSFRTTWETTGSITIPTAPNTVYNYSVDWGDGSSDSNVTGTITHTYAQAGTYQVSISGEFPRIFFSNSKDREKIFSVDNWGSIQWSSMVNAFEGCSKLEILASDSPNLSRVESLSGMLRYATAVNQSLNNWNVSNVKSIANMFEGASSFNGDIGNWDTSNINMYAYTFRNATSFNRNLNSWDMSNALSTNAMFADARSFNQPVSTWDMSNVLDMRNMFANATSFNQNVSNWKTDSMQRAESIFRNAIRFEQDVSSWNFSSLKDGNYMFSGTRLTGQNYDNLLFALADAELQQGVTFDAGSSTYCTAESARNKVVTSNNWTIEDNGKNENGCGDLDIRFDIGVAAAIDENKPAKTVIGSLLTISPNTQTSFSYEFCDVNADDQKFFSLNGSELLSAVSFDFENPQDKNQDNVYDICIRSTDENGFSIERLLTVAVLDIEDSETTPNAPRPEVLADTTDDDAEGSGPEVLAESDETGKVLAATGIAMSIFGFYLGTGIVALAYIIFKQSRDPDASIRAIFEL